ncbi:MAG: M4 family metallopeptidase [Lewinellaceae bacterium]|nr:M4 family metallopeptidase [Lewinellaceae bacterium]
MKTYWSFQVLFILLVTPLVSFAQTHLSDIAQRDAATGWINFKPGVRMAPEVFFSRFQTELGLTSADQLKPVRSWTDNIGVTHHLFHQHHSGVQVEGAVMVLHERNGELTTANGQLAAFTQTGNQPLIGIDLARQKSIDAVGAKSYAWEDETLENQLRADTKSPDTSWFPQPQLVYVQRDRSKQFLAENMALAYRSLIYATDPHEPFDIYVDAYSGQVLQKESLIIECVPGTGATNYYGQKSIDVEASGSNFVLFDDCRGLGVKTYTGTFGNVTSTTTSFPASSQNQNSGHWCVEQTYDYFFNAHLRNSFNDAGAVMTTRVGGYGANACWDQVLKYVTILDGDGGGLSKSLAALDVVGHEWTHAVTQFNGTGGLNYNYESGALNESFSDMFGTMVEFYPAGGYGDYFIGDDCWVPGGMLRNMKDPKLKGQPDTYHGQNWYFGTFDNGGVHTNSGVPNHWFYLLAEGSSATDGVNDNGDAFTVSGIGRAKAAAIAYRTLITYLTPTSNFFAARAGSIQAAIDLYGANSNEARQVANAWYAVGVGKDDLMMKDNLADNGAEPSNGINIFLALDIWVRKTPDFLNTTTGHYQHEHISEDLMATGGANPSHVYVKIRNIGNVASQGGKLIMYWSRASTGLNWPLHWTNSFLCPPNPNYPGWISICGDQFVDYTSGSAVLTDFPIPSIPAGKDYTQHISWFPPDPALLPGTGNQVEDTHFCLLARIVRDNDPMHDEQTNITCSYNTWQNNNIAWKNIRILPSNGVYIANPTNMCVRSRRIIDNGQPARFRIQDDNQNPFLPKGDILVHLPDSLFALWALGGKQGAGFEEIPGTQTVKLLESTAFLDGIDMEMGKDYSICLAFNPFDGKPIDVPGNYLATIAQLEKKDPMAQYEVVGGEGFELHVNPFPIWAGNDVTICQGDSLMLTADLSNWNQNDSTYVFWDTGETGPSILVAPGSTQTFTVGVTNGDGNIATDEVTVFVQSPIAWYFDADGDGFGSDQVAYFCQPPAGYVDNALDCDDQNNSIYPGAPEICNSVDDNCDGQIDEDLALILSWRDLDGDGYGDPNTTVLDCVVPQNYVFNNADCDDQNPAVHPDAIEVCNGIDDNCDGQIDEGFVCYTSSVDFDGLLYQANSKTGLLLSGDSLLVANTATAADTFSVHVDANNSVNYNLWYSFAGTPGAVITQDYFGTVNGNPAQSLGKSTLTQLSADEFATTIAINNVDTLHIKAYLKDTLVCEDLMLNGGSANYLTTSGGDEKPKWDAHILYVPQPGDRPPLVWTVYEITPPASTSLKTPACNVLCDVVQFQPTALTPDTIALKSISVSATGLSELVLNRAIAIQADPSSLTFCAGDTLNLTATTDANASFQWQKDFLDIAGAISANYQSLESGSYRVKVTAKNTAYTSQSLPVTMFSQAECDAASSIPWEISLLKVRILPNPNTGTFTVELPQPASPGMAFRITDITGRLTLDAKTETGAAKQTIQASNLPNGLYFLQVLEEGKVLAVEKFVKQ